LNRLPVVKICGPSRYLASHCLNYRSVFAPQGLDNSGAFQHSSSSFDRKRRIWFQIGVPLHTSFKALPPSQQNKGNSKAATAVGHITVQKRNSKLIFSETTRKAAWKNLDQSRGSNGTSTGSKSCTLDLNSGCKGFTKQFFTAAWLPLIRTLGTKSPTADLLTNHSCPRR
jgi:hypothetical protein